MDRRNILRAMALAPLSISLAKFANAAYWPARELTFNVPVAPGGGGDLSSRALMGAVATRLGVPVVVKNVTGASGAIGLRALSQAEPDGYLAGLVGVTSHVILPRTADLGFDPMQTTEPVAQIFDVKYGVAVPANSQIRTIDDLIALGRKQRLNYASSFVGNVVAMYKLARLTGANFNWVRTQSGPEAVTQTAGGHVDATIQSVSELMPMLKSGALRLIASASTTRWKEFPDIPTLRESGYDAANVSILGVAMPKGAPAEARQRLEATIGEALKDEALNAQIAALGIAVSYGTAMQFRKTLEEQQAELVPLLIEVGMAKQGR